MLSFTNLIKCTSDDHLQDIQSRLIVSAFHVPQLNGRMDFKPIISGLFGLFTAHLLPLFKERRFGEKPFFISYVFVGFLGKLSFG
jgi:hypothetical protein